MSDKYLEVEKKLRSREEHHTAAEAIDLVHVTSEVDNKASSPATNLAITLWKHAAAAPRWASFTPAAGRRAGKDRKRAEKKIFYVQYTHCQNYSNHISQSQNAPQ